jgi:hypothetical protein
MTTLTNVYSGGDIHVAAGDTPDETLCGLPAEHPSRLPVSCATCQHYATEALFGRRLLLVNRGRKERKK